MDSVEFINWANKLGLSDETINEIQRVRLAPPARRVGSGKRNVSGRYSSRKMHCTIQFESHKVELPTIYELEFNDDVLEYYDQPTKVKVFYEKNNKRNAYWKTADFFVIEKDRAYWLECKTEDDLVELSQKNPERYYLLDDQWVFEPGKTYAESFNLQFLIKSSNNINWTFSRNINFLEDYIVRDYVVKSEVIEHIQQVVSSEPGICLKDLLEISKVTADDIYTLIANRTLFINLNKELLVEPNNTKVYLNHEQYKSLLIVSEVLVKTNPNKLELAPGNQFIWGNSSIWEILNVDYTLNLIFLYRESDGKHTEIPINILEGYISKGFIQGIMSELKKEKEDKIKSIISKASDKDLAIALEKYEMVLANAKGLKMDNINITNRTLRNWTKQYNNAEEIYGNGFLGLIPKIKSKGNRESKLPLASKELMEDFITNNYETFKQKSAKAVYRELLIKCDELIIEPPSYQSFCKAIKNRPVHAVTKARKGERAAYNDEEFYMTLNYTTPKHGDRIFEIVHIDHTELDIELKLTDEHSIRPWLTLMVDAYSRRVLAYYLTFDAPSYRSCMMVIRECVKKYNRLPNYIVVDGGKEFGSVNFESLLAMYGVHKKQRPPAKSRFGNVVERLFGISNTMLINNLQGNTQITKNVRQVTKSVNPKNHSVWKIELLDELLSNWFDNVYDNMINPTLHQSPKQTFTESLSMSGERLNTYITYDETFIISTLPAPENKTRKVNPGKGIKLTYSYYWCDEFRKVENTKVEVKYDPYNMAIAYAYVNGVWMKCVSEQSRYLFNKTEKEIKLISEEIRKKNTLHSRSNTITARNIASFILESEKVEESLKLEKLKNNNSRPTLSEVLQIKEIEDTISSDDLSPEELEFFGELM